jgi:hypothetical protein
VNLQLPVVGVSFSRMLNADSFPGPLAQLVEQLTLNQRVEGSNPSRLTLKNQGVSLQWLPLSLYIDGMLQPVACGSSLKIVIQSVE